MAEYKSEVKVIPHSHCDVYSVLSDLNNLELAKDIYPEEKIKKLTFDQDSCSISVPPIGNIRFVIVERELNSRIKFQAEKVPFGVNMYINIEAVKDNETHLSLVVDADLSPFLKPMVSKPLQEGLEQVAQLLSGLPYDSINNKTSKS